ncbi:hypothetical protein ACIQXD_34570 [Streptomyces uncialis]|uniref:hypothetical protein n=1 Tax=Streptomyces uncialis TaxID=1048205 RepID=UPI00380DFF27
MTSGRGASTALHLVLVWATMTVAVPVLGLGVFAAGWGGGVGAALVFLALGAPLTVGLLALTGIPVRAVVPMCASGSQRIRWAVLVFVLGTPGVLAGLAAYSEDIGLGDAGTRAVLVGVPYAVAAAFFVPGRWVRLGATAVLVAGVAYGGFLGPARSQQREHEAETARYRGPGLLYLGDAPPGMRVFRAEAGPAHFWVGYQSVRDAYESVTLVTRPASTPASRCPEPAEKGATCRVDGHGEMRTVRVLPPDDRSVTLTRRYRNLEVEVQGLARHEPRLRHLLDTLRPLSDPELEELIREKKIDHRF